MSQVIGVPKETIAGETRVAMVPDLIPKLRHAGMEVWLDSSAGLNAGFPDEDYLVKGARIGREVFAALMTAADTISPARVTQEI